MVRLILVTSLRVNDKSLFGHEEAPFIETLKGKYALSQGIAEALAYAVAHCSHPEGPCYDFNPHKINIY